MVFNTSFCGDILFCIDKYLVQDFVNSNLFYKVMGF